MKINKSILLLYSAGALLFALLIGTAFYYSSIQKDDAVRINLAGRQRMLSQKIVKELLLYSSGKIPRNRLTQSIEVFSQTQEALIYGGPAPITLDSAATRILPKSKDRETILKLLEAKQIWESLESKITDVITKNNKQSLEYIISNNEIFLDKINESVYALQKQSEKNSLITRIIIILLIIIIFLFFVISIYRKIRELSKADKRIKELETLLPICSSCKKIRLNDKEPMNTESWTSIEEYLHTKNEMIFTHTVCPDCMKKLYPGIKAIK